MKTRQLAAILAFAGLAFATTAAQAAADVFTDRESMRVAEQCDANKDGMVSKDELMKRMEMAWTKADPHNKGMLDKAAMNNFLNTFYNVGQ